jgi:hypothetical protein
VILLILFGGAGLLIGSLWVPLLLRRVPPNGSDGLRSAATLENEVPWYEANAGSGME